VWLFIIEKFTQFANNAILLVCEEDTHYLENRKSENYYNELKNKIDYILLQMDNNLSQIIYNEFFSNKNDGWWIYYYSNNTYYRLKNKAMDSFLEWWYV